MCAHTSLYDFKSAHNATLSKHNRNKFELIFVRRTKTGKFRLLFWRGFRDSKLLNWLNEAFRFTIVSYFGNFEGIFISRTFSYFRWIDDNFLLSAVESEIFNFWANLQTLRKSCEIEIEKKKKKTVAVVPSMRFRTTAYRRHLAKFTTEQQQMRTVHSQQCRRLSSFGKYSRNVHFSTTFWMTHHIYVYVTRVALV